MHKGGKRTTSLAISDQEGLVVNAEESDSNELLMSTDAEDNFASVIQGGICFGFVLGGKLRGWTVRFRDTVPTRS